MFALWNCLNYTALIVKELVKHETKCKRKVFHEQKNSENWSSEL